MFSKSLRTCELASNRSLIKRLERRLFLNNLFLFQTLFFVFNVNEHLAVPFVELPYCLSISAVTQTDLYLLLEIFPFTSILFSVCLFGCSNSMCPSSISPSGLIQGNKWEAERGTLEPWVTAGTQNVVDLIRKGGPQALFHTNTMVQMNPGALNKSGVMTHDWWHMTQIPRK